MALSASIDFSQDVRAIIDYALKKMRVLGQGQTATGSEAEDARVELNTLLKEWQQYPNLWRHTAGSITLVADDVDYTLSVTPHRVIEARYRNTDSYDLPMHLMTREEYFNLPNKASNGTPSQYYVDYQWDSTVFYVWQINSSVTTETIQYTYQKKFDDLDTLDDDVEVRSEHYSALGYALAARLIDDYGRSGPTVDRIIARSEVLFQQALDADREDEYRFYPDMVGYGASGSNTPY